MRCDQTIHTNQMMHVSDDGKSPWLRKVVSLGCLTGGKSEKKDDSGGKENESDEIDFHC